MPLNDEQRKKIVVVAESWQGTPFAGPSCLKGAGVDCAQVLGGVYREAGYWCGDGIVLPDEYSLQIGQHAEDTRYIDIVGKYMREIPESEVKPGDVVIYKMGLAFAHAGIVKFWPSHIIHVTERNGVTAGHGASGALGRLARKFFTLKDCHCKGVK